MTRTSSRRGRLPAVHGTRSVRTGVVAIAAAALTSTIAACSDSTSATRAAQSSSAVAAASAPQDPARCTEKPPSGTIDRQGFDLSFTRGQILIASGQTTASPSAQEGRTALPATSAAQQMSSAPACYEFARWGQPKPDVPPDTLLFVFKGDGTDGAQIEFPVGELTGEHLPPTDGPRPPVGPLTAPITASVGLSERGMYRSSSACRLTVTAMSSKRAAGSFECPESVASAQNPLAPDDDVPFDDEGTTSTGTPAPDTASQRPVRLTGWFDLRP
ncbi:hypothetical protein [Gordonia aichiensis]|uniref:hypothetical protein n=1 Tax=Gordonia aichiensis TaxID=36820 RepID=UPI001FDF59E0|nr:hypothetical protein [Gordonia aichiensis]